MTRISDRFLQLGVLFALAGMGLGVWMGGTENFQLQAVHAHVNLLGWVSMLLYGLVYRVMPKAAEGRLPVAHFWLSLVSVLGMIPLLSLNLMGQRSVVPFLAVDMVALWLSMALFAVIIFRATARSSATA